MPHSRDTCQIIQHSQTFLSDFQTGRVSSFVASVISGDRNMVFGTNSVDAVVRRRREDSNSITAMVCARRY